MLKPEVLSVPWDILLKGSKKDYAAYFDRICVCEHGSFSHDMIENRRVDLSADQIVFTKCGAWKCPCAMFKRDNLKYLEAEALRNGY